MHAQFAATGTPYRFFDAIDGTGIVPVNLSDTRFDRREFLRKTGRLASRPEIARFASHRALWKKCISMNRSMIVLEDDVVLRSTFESALPEISRLTNRYGFVRLESARNCWRRLKPVRKLSDVTLYYYRLFPVRTTAYAINPDTAREFIHRSHTVNNTLDAFIKEFWRHRQPLFGILPAPVARSGLGFPGSIIPRDLENRGCFASASRSLARVNNWLARESFNLHRRPWRDHHPNPEHKHFPASQANPARH